MLRSAWLAQEILTTFDGDVAEVSLAPQHAQPGGEFTILVNDDVVVWDRRTDGGFPEAKQLKQRIRDAVRPDRDLGHSETQRPADETRNS